MSWMEMYYQAKFIVNVIAYSFLGLIMIMIFGYALYCDRSKKKANK